MSARRHGSALWPERIDRLNGAAGRLGGLALLLMLGLGLWNVIGRYLGLALGLNLSSNALIEAQWLLFSLAFLLGMGWTLQRDGHVRIDVLSSHWPERRRLRLEWWGLLLLLLPFALAVLLLSVGPALEAWRIGEASPDPGGLPRAWGRSLIPLGFALLLLQGLAQALRVRAALGQERRAALAKRAAQEGSHGA
ncbi:MAG: TRAP transporter small permease subunit [Cyanobium sp.]|jgi:TRAP-type mannitol/chloroaromatic compound transport system permease small subunit